MAGYIGKSQGVTQVDGYNRTEADDRYVNDPDAVITVSGGNVGFGTNFPSAKLEVNGDVKSNKFAFYNEGAGANFNYTGYARFANGATESMRIDSAGRVTMPYQPAFHAIYANGYAVTLGGGTRYALHGRALTNRGNHYNASTGYFTAPVSGVYAFSIGLAANATAHSSGFIVVEAEINGATKADLYSSSSDIIAQGEGGHSSVEWVVSLNAGDYFRPYYYTSVSYATGGGSNSWTQARNFFSGYLIG